MLYSISTRTAPKCLITDKSFSLVSNAFEDIAEAFRDERFIECLKRNQLRFPEIFDEIQLEIDYAIRVLSGGDD